MVNRLVSVGDDFTLPPAVKAEDVNLPGRLQVGELNATFAGWDVRAAPPTGNAATDTANLQAMINACPAGGVAYFRGAYKINDALTIDKEMTLIGGGVRDNYVLGQSIDDPTGNPILLGTTITQVTAAKDALKITSKGVAVDLHRFGVLFDPAIAGNTGHGINAEPGGTTLGLTAMNWSELRVAGHDGNHYAWYLHNTVNTTTSDLRSYGGGGFLHLCDHPALNLGNAVHTHPFVCINTEGTAHGFAHSSLTSGGTYGYLNLITYVRPQCNVTTATPTSQETWKDNLGPGVPGNIVALNPDLEASPTSSNILYQGNGTEFIGGDQFAAGGGNTRYGRKAMPRIGGTANSTAFGNSALLAVTTGQDNTAIGSQALKVATTAGRVVAVGTNALAAVTNGPDNTAVGRNAGTAITSGQENTFVGSGAGATGTVQIRATLIGSGATGAQQYVTGLGWSATASGFASTAIGAGTSATHDGGVAIGRDSANTPAATGGADDFILGTVQHKVKIAGRLNVARRTPTSSADAQGTTGDITTDDSYVYVKTSTGWKRAALTTW